MNRRFVRTVLYVLAAGQVLLSAPIASAIGNGATAATVEMPCADSMPQTDDSKPCPCCPDGVTSIAACLSACTASVAALPVLAVHAVNAVSLPSPAAVFPQIADLADPPLKPPPIV